MGILISGGVSGGGSGGAGNGFIPFDLRSALALNNLADIEFRQNRASNRNYARRVALAGAGADVSSDLYAEIQLPSGFTGWFAGNNLFLDVYSTDRANNTAVIYVYGQDGTVDTSVNGTSIQPSADTVWEQFATQIQGTGGVTYTAGDFITIRVNTNLDANDEYRFARGYVRIAE